MLAAGTHLHKRYRILRSIGAGGMGAVYESVDTRLRNTVAVKQLAIAGAAADRAFEREAQLLASLRHPVLPVVIDYFTDRDDRYLVMQYIEGEDFAHYLERQSSACSHDEVVAVATAVLDALEYLHTHSPPIIHRDIKPANLKRTPTGDVVLLDFGLAKGRLDHDSTVAREDRSLYGFTLKYAPPEQIEGRPTDGRSDLFALGATLYHLAVGAPPPTALERVMAVRNGYPDPLVAADVTSPAIDSVLSRAISVALQLEPADRFASAAEMRSALSALATPAAERPDPTTVERRVDAALPSQVEVGRQTDLIVQVRFASSPLLGLEDWPTARRPDHVDQQSEPLEVTHLVDPATGRLLPARVRIKIVASDFAIEGDAERLIEVPVNDYSKRIAFLLTPRRAGYCRVNVEVYALDALYLGTVAVEAEAFGVSVPEPVQNVAHMRLGTVARHITDANTVIKPAISATADTVEMRVALPDATMAANLETRRAESVTARVEAPAPPPTLAMPAPPAAAAARVPDTLSRATSEPQQQRRSLASRLSVLGGVAAAVLIAGVVFTAWPMLSLRDANRAADIPPTQVATQSAGAGAPPPNASQSRPPDGTGSTGMAQARPAAQPQPPMPAPSASAPPAPPEAPTAAPATTAAAPAPEPQGQIAPTMAAAAELEASGDLVEALRLFELVRRADPSNTDAEHAVSRVLALMKREGDQAFIKASQFDAADRIDDAIKSYEQAFKLLPDDDPYRKIAKQRLDVLRAKK